MFIKKQALVFKKIQPLSYLMNPLSDISAADKVLMSLN